MVNELLVDVENVFKWQRTDGERIPNRGRIEYIQDQLRAVIWWSDEHMPPPAGITPGWMDAIRGYGKLDPSGEAFTQALLTWSPWLEPEANHLERDERAGRFTATLDRTRPLPKDRIIVRTVTGPGVSATFRLVKFGPDEAELALLADADAALAKAPGTNRLVLCSRDHLVVEFWEQQTGEGEGLLLTYRDPKDKKHLGDSRVATLSVVVGVCKTLNRTGRTLAPGTEITRELLDELRSATKPARPRRGRRPASQRDSSAATPPRHRTTHLARPLDVLRAVDWEGLIAEPPSAKSWGRAWANDDLHLTVAAVMEAELKRLHATNDELGRCIEGLWGGATDDALIAYRAFALIALHRLSEGGGESLGAAIRSDPELHEGFWRSYVLVQPYLGVAEAAAPGAVPEKTAPSRHPHAHRSRKPRLHEAAAELGIDSKTALHLLREAGVRVPGPASSMGPAQLRMLRKAVEAHLAVVQDEAEAG